MQAAGCRQPVEPCVERIETLRGLRSCRLRLGAAVETHIFLLVMWFSPVYNRSSTYIHVTLYVIVIGLPVISCTLNRVPALLSLLARESKTSIVRINFN